MNQFHWTYWDYLGTQHVVGILHGIKTGHLLIHLNSNVLIIDFDVRQAKKYSFLINEEICELEIEANGNDFKYNLGVNPEQAAQHRAVQRKKEKKFLYQKIGAVLATTSMLIVLSLLIYYIKH